MRSNILLETTFVAFVGVLSTFAQTQEAKAPPAAAVEIERAERERDPGMFTQGISAGDDFFESRSDLLLPLRWWSGSDGVLLINGRMVFTDGGAQEMNLGFIARQYCLPWNGILGASAFYDSRWTENDTQFNQLGLGIEALTDWVDARANVYMPDSKREFINREERVSFTETRAVSDTSFYGAGHEVRQSWTESTTRTTTREIVSVYEVPLKGFDAEIGVKLPIDSDWLQARVFAGYYDFESKGGDTGRIAGPKGRLELRAWDKVFLDAEFFDDKELFGSDYIVSLRVRVPLDAGALRAYTEPSPHNRMLEMVMRDPHIQTAAAVEQKSSQTSTSKSQKHDELYMDDVIFVDNSRGSDNNVGTAENPTATIQAGVNLIAPDGSGLHNIVVHGTSNPYAENIVVKNAEKVNIFGAGSFGSTLGGAPVLKSGGAGMTVAIDDLTLSPILDASSVGEFSISGFTFEGTDALKALNIRELGILANDVRNVDISGNSFNNLYSGVFVRNNNAAFSGGDIRIANNQFTQSSGSISAKFNTDAGNISIIGNRINGVVDMGYVELRAYGSSGCPIAINSIDISDNAVNGMRDGIVILLSDVNVAEGVSIMRNAVTDFVDPSNEVTSNWGIYSRVDGTSSAAFTVIGNTIIGGHTPPLANSCGIFFSTTQSDLDAGRVVINGSANGNMFDGSFLSNNQFNIKKR